MRLLCALLALLPALAWGDDAEPGTPETPEAAPTEIRPRAEPAPQAPPPARADAPAAEARPKLALKGPAPRVVTVFEGTDPGVRDQVDRVEGQLNSSLTRDARLLPVSAKMDGEAPPPEDLSEAQKHLDAAKAAYEGLDLDGAVQEYAAAIKVYLAHPLSSDAKAVATAFIAWGAAYQLNGDKAHADGAYRFAAAVAPGLEPDKQIYGPDIRSEFAAQKQALEQAQQASPASVTVELDGAPHAEVLIDGQRAGNAPLRGFKLYPGRHLLVARASGYLPAGQVISVAPGSDTPVRLALEETEAHRTFAGARARAQAEFSLPTAGPGCAELAHAANAQLVVVGQLSSAESGTRIDLVLFDAIHHQRLAALSRVAHVESTQFPATMDDLAAELANDYVEPPEGFGDEGGGPSRPLVKRWYFWAGVGAAVAAGAAAAYVKVNAPPGGLHTGAGVALGLH